MAALTTAEWTPDATGEILDLSVGDLLRATAERAPDTPALVAGTPDPADRRRWSYAELLDDAERVARALLGRFAPGDRVAVWANNIPEWVVLELGAGLAGMTIVTVNPALRSSELVHVLGQSRADGIFLVDEYRGTPMGDMLAAVRGELPLLREVVPFSVWDAFRAEGSPTERLPEVDPLDARADPVHVRDDRTPEGRDAASPRDRQQRPAVPRAARARPGQCPAQPDAAVPHRRLRDERARRGGDRGHARPAARVRPGARPPAGRGGARRVDDRRADDAHRAARPPGLRPHRQLEHPLPAHRRRRRDAVARPARRDDVRRRR